MTTEVTLYDWGPSPFCHKVRAVLDHKGVEYRRAPALPNFFKVRRKGGIGKVPALEIDGVFLVDSTDIVHELERRFPQRPVLPSDPRERALCHLLEDQTDEALYFHGLYFHWREPKGRAAAEKFFAKQGFLGRLAFRPFLARVSAQLDGQGTGRKPEAQVRADLARTLDAYEALLDGRDFLLGEGPYLCDFGLATQLTYLCLAAGTRTLLDDRPALSAFVARVTPRRSR